MAGIAGAQSLEGKMYDANCGARTLRNLTRMLRDRISGGVPSSVEPKPEQPGPPTAHASVDETNALLKEATSILNSVCNEFGAGGQDQAMVTKAPSGY